MLGILSGIPVFYPPLPHVNIRTDTHEKTPICTRFTFAHKPGKGIQHRQLLKDNLLVMEAPYEDNWRRQSSKIK